MFLNVRCAFLLVYLPMKLAMDPLTEDLLTPVAQLGERCGYDSCFPVRDGWINVHLVPHTHAELGKIRTFHEYYTGGGENYLHSNINMKRIFDSTISELWANKFRKFTISGSELPYFFYWWARRDGTVHRMVYELIRQGRLIIVGGDWGMNDEATTSYQSIIDSYTYSLRKINATFLSCGRPRVAWQADAFGHSREYASLVALMGFDAFFINPISFDDEMIRMERRALEFVWRGSDDLGPKTDVYTHKLFDGYWSPPGFCFGSMCGDPLLVTRDNFFSNVDERIDQFVKSIRHRQSPHYNTNHVMVVMGQRMGYFDARMWFVNIDKLINAFNSRGYKSGEKMHAIYSTPVCYLKAVYEDNPTLETKQDDFLPYAYNKHSYTTGTFTSRPTFKYLVRESNVYLQMTKQLHVLLNLGNYDKLLENFNWIMGVVQDHNIITGAMQPYIHSYYTKKIHFAVMWATELFQNAFNKIRGTAPSTEYRLCYFNISCCPNTKSKRFYITIYNPLAWPVTLPVRLPIWNRTYEVFDPKGVPLLLLKDYCFATKSMTKQIYMETYYPKVIVRKLDLNRNAKSLGGKKTPATKIIIRDHIFKIPNRVVPVTHELVFIAKNIPALGMRSYFIEKERNTRIKKSLIKKMSKKQQKKKMSKKQQKKYLARQAAKENGTYFEENREYYDYDEGKPETKIDFGNIVKAEDARDHDAVITPRNKVKNETVEELNVMEITTKNIEDRHNDTVAVESSTESFSSTVGAEVSTKFVSWTKESVTELPKENLNEYDCRESDDKFIRNKYVQINLDDYGKVASVNLSNGVNISLDIQYHYYISDEPRKDTTARKPSAYIFRPVDVKPEAIIDYIDTKVHKSGTVEEIHTEYSNYASFAVKLYADSPVVEIDWAIGPVFVDDGFGKEVFVRYTTDLVNDGVFYTDANGRQTIKRIRHSRATYEPYEFHQVAGNFYPVTSRIYIEDTRKKLRFSIFNDRSQGGASLLEGSVDLMLHRRILTSAGDGLPSFLNETENGAGITVRGTHHMYLTKSESKQNRVFERKLAKELEMRPQIMVNSIKQDVDKETWMAGKNEFSSLKKKLPIGVHLLTVQEWGDKTLLLRLENYLEKVDAVSSGVKKVIIKDLFLNIEPFGIVETMLAGNIRLEDHEPLHWRANGSFVRSFNEYYGTSEKVEYADDEPMPVEKVGLGYPITLVPQQIRTFVIQYEYTNNNN